MRITLFVLCFGAALLSGCVSQRPVVLPLETLKPKQETEADPTPSQPEQSFQEQEPEKDALGAVIYSPNHYMRYLTFSNLRVYEYSGGTFLDGICENTYPYALNAKFEVVFFDDKGAETARAELYPQNESACFEPGKSAVYADIDTDIDVQLMEFKLACVEGISPAA
ncbi:MAG TPA: hypothetical protein PLH38_02000 [Clostridia bacterium]|nr:hypothetical protein [Clostridia bacterium]